MAGMIRLTVAEALVRFLAAQETEFDGVRTPAFGGIWAIWGHGNVCALSRALADPAARLPMFQPRNEQGMVHAALGYAKAMNRRAFMACSASIGPGSTNMLTGAATASVNRLPVLLLASDGFAHRRPGTVLQQVEHPVDFDVSANDAFRPLSRFFDRISRPEQLLPALPAAMRVLTDPAETGAVTLALPQDVQGEVLDLPEDWLAPRLWPIDRRPPAAAAVARAAELLAAARRPLIVAGGGVRYAAAEAALVAFAEAHGVPVAETHAGRGVAARAGLCLGGMGVSGTTAAAATAAEADAVLCIGTRLTDFTTASRSAFADPGVRFVHLNVNAADAAKLRGVALVADARLGLEALGAALAPRGWTTDPAWRAEVAARIAAWRAAYAADLGRRQGGPMTQAEIIAAVNAASRPGDVVVAAAGTPPGEIKKGWDAGTGAEIFLEFGFSCMGHEIPAALGVRLARPAAGEVYAVIGDGTYLMAPTELLTAVQEGAKITVVVIENGGFQCIRDLQEATTGLEDFGNEFRRRRPGARAPDGAPLVVDYVANAASLGARAVRAETPGALAAALAEARAEPGPVVIVAPADPRATSLGNGAWWDLGVAPAPAGSALGPAAAAQAAGRAAQRVLS